MNFAPRVGLAWDVKGDGRTSVRAAYGLFYDLPQLFWINANQHQPGWGYQVQLGATSFEDPWGELSWRKPISSCALHDQAIPRRRNALHIPAPSPVDVYATVEPERPAAVRHELDGVGNLHRQQRDPHVDRV